MSATEHADMQCRQLQSLSSFEHGRSEHSISLPLIHLQCTFHAAQSLCLIAVSVRLQLGEVDLVLPLEMPGFHDLTPFYKILCICTVYF